jgi:Flp pilus assembly pilin Flp
VRTTPGPSLLGNISAPLLRVAPLRTDHRSETQAGATAVEYALMLSLVALVIFGAVAALGSSLGRFFSDFSETLAHLIP